MSRISLVCLGLMIPLSVTGTDIAIFATLVFGVLSGEIFAHRKAIMQHPFCLPLLLFMSVVCMGVFWSIAPWSERLNAVHKYSKLLYILPLLPIAADRIWSQRAIHAFLFGMFITVCISYLKAYAHLKFGRTTEPAWVFHNHIETSYFVAFSCYILLNHILSQNQKYFFRYFCIILLLFFSYQEFFLNEGRTGWLVYLVLLVLSLVQQGHPSPLGLIPQSGWFRLKNLAYGLFIGGLSAILLCVSMSIFSVRFHRYSQETWSAVTHQLSWNNLLSVNHADHSIPNAPKAVEPRIHFIGFTIALVKLHPVFGLGSGSFAQAYRQYGGIPGGVKTLHTPHNEYLLVLSQFGFVGLMVLLYWFYSQARATLFLIDNQKIAQALVVAQMVGCAFDSFLFTSVAGYFYVFFTCVLFRAAHRL